MGLRQAEGTHLLPGIDAEAELVEQAGGHPVETAGIDEAAEALRFAAEKQIFGNRHVGNWRQFLGDNGDSRGERLRRVDEIDAAAANLDLPGVAAQQAHDDVEKGALAGAIAATERMNGAGPERQSPIA